MASLSPTQNHSFMVTLHRYSQNDHQNYFNLKKTNSFIQNSHQKDVHQNLIHLYLVILTFQMSQQY